jgi:hypothetical protein
MFKQIGWIAATLAVSITGGSIAHAGSATPLTDTQLDRVTAGTVGLATQALAHATGKYTTTYTTTSTAVAQDPSIVPGFGAQGGNTSGVAVAYTLPGSSSGPGTQDTAVSSQGGVTGNYIMGGTHGGTVTAAGMTITVQFTSVYGAWVPGF